MSDFAPPSGPPPPRVPEGWKAQWNDQYSEWFYVNIYTKKSQWDKPTEPVHPPSSSGDAPPAGAPPGYDHSKSQQVGPEKGEAGAFGSNNPYSSGAGGSAHDISEDEKLARQLQAEEDARNNTGSRGASDSYYNSSDQHQGGGYPSQQELPPRPQDRGSGSKGFLGKLLGKNKVNQPPASQPYGQQSYGQPQYGQPPYNQQQYNQPQGYGGGYPQQSYGPPSGQYGGGYPPQGGYGGGYGGYPPQQQQVAGRRQGGGMGMAGGAALGAAGGLVGGMLLMDAIDDHDQDSYQEGYQDGQDNDYGGGGDDGGDF